MSACGEFCSGGTENWWHTWLWGQRRAEGLAGLCGGRRYGRVQGRQSPGHRQGTRGWGAADAACGLLLCAGDRKQRSSMRVGREGAGGHSRGGDSQGQGVGIPGRRPAGMAAQEDG